MFIYTSGQEVLPIGGFTGTTPSPTLSRFKAGIRCGQFHLVLVSTPFSGVTDTRVLSTAGPRIKWIAARCRDQRAHTYDCVSADAG